MPSAFFPARRQRRGTARSLTSLFVRGGESRYNKVIVDGVTVNEPGGTFDFGTLPHERGRTPGVRPRRAEHSLWVRCHHERGPGMDAERQYSGAGVALGADGGNFETASGDAALAGAQRTLRLQLVRKPAQYERSGINNAYSDSLQGANVGAALNDRTSPADSRSALQFAYRRSWRMGFQWDAAAAAGSERLVATQRPCSAARNSSYGPVRLGASPYGLRLSVSLLRTQCQRGSWARVRFPFERG